MKNFYPSQYQSDKKFEINHNYLSDQFSDKEVILQKIASVVESNDFTLGSTVDDVESLIAKEANTQYAVGVGSGTDALFLSLKALGIGPGDEVITCTYTFYATIGAIVTAGAKPIFCDCSTDYNIDVSQIRNLITSKTKAIVPVHWSGRPCDMDPLLEIAKEHNLHIVEDACHALQAEYNGQRCGSFGTTGCFSFHPLKNLNVWGDGGIITTNEESLSDRLKLIRNHGLVGRNTCVEFSYNSRLDTIQAVVAKHLIETRLDNITASRRLNAFTLDSELSKIQDINITPRNNSLKEVFHLYMFTTPFRDKLVEHLHSFGIDAKIHYPIPMHLQPASKDFGYALGDFPVAETLASQCISLPVHEFVTTKDVNFMIDKVRSFFKV
ncbi:DegT/DnrJ/EryC1/StrS family aminotransferase [bacterium]|nr:DegT/DnrJ/EryC1/StrS family aminotransferase [bacterium]